MVNRRKAIRAFAEQNLYNGTVNIIVAASEEYNLTYN